MKRILGLTTAALMGASVLAAPALAEGGLVSGTADGGAASQMDAAPDLGGADADIDTGVDTGTTAAIGGSFDGALSAIGANASNVAAISAIGEVNSVNVVSIDTLEGHDATAVEQAVSENSADVDELRDTIAGNPALSEELQAQSVDISSVVAAEVGAGGEITVYVM